MTESHTCLQKAWLVCSLFIELPSHSDNFKFRPYFHDQNFIVSSASETSKDSNKLKGTMINLYRFFGLVFWLILAYFLLTSLLLDQDLGAGTRSVSFPTLNDSNQVIMQVSSSTPESISKKEDIDAVDPATKWFSFIKAMLPQFRKRAVEKARELLKDEMRGLSFPTNKSISDFVIEDGGDPVRSLVFTTWRSGSTFLGDILHSHPGTYYHFEPLMHFGILQVREGESSKEALRVLRELFDCRYASLADYMKNEEIGLEVFHMNKRIWSFCTLIFQFCLDHEWLSTMCRMFPFQVVKITRMRLDLARSLLEDEKLNVRVLYLVRDPRGTVQSRSHHDWCPGNPDCENPERLCKDLVSDFYAAQRLQQEFPGQFMIVRYEDMAGSIYNATKKILKFFQLQYHPQVQRFLDEHTKSNDGGDYSTFRDTKSAPFHWMQDFSSNFTAIETIQNDCREAMALWGYDIVESPEELEGFNPVLDAPWDDMNIPPAE